MNILKEPITTTAVYDGRVLIPEKRPLLPRGRFWIVLLPQSKDKGKDVDNNYQKSTKKIAKTASCYRDSTIKNAYGLLRDKDNIDPLEYQHIMRDELEEHFNKLFKIR